jgi:hypothetical protein
MSACTVSSWWAASAVVLELLSCQPCFCLWCYDCMQCAHVSHARNVVRCIEMHLGSRSCSHCCFSLQCQRPSTADMLCTRPGLAVQVVQTRCLIWSPAGPPSASAVAVKQSFCKCRYTRRTCCRLRRQACHHPAHPGSSTSFPARAFCQCQESPVSELKMIDLRLAQVSLFGAPPSQATLSCVR